MAPTRSEIIKLSALAIIKDSVGLHGLFKFAKLVRSTNKVASQGRRGAQVIADGGARKTLESVAIFTYGH